MNGTVAYVAAYQGSLQVVSFSTPAAPVHPGDDATERSAAFSRTWRCPTASPSAPTCCS